MPDTSAGGHAAPIPRSFVDYLRSFGPGLVMVLTWLGAGDVIDMATAGANHGYALMWMFVVAVLLRFLFVSLIARYQLCNQHGEGGPVRACAPAFIWSCERAPAVCDAWARRRA
jgi:Mn2+/Fe2+ NRAMP family transporter